MTSTLTLVIYMAILTWLTVLLASLIRVKGWTPSGTMMALGQWDEFRLHVRAALSEGGFTPDDIKEIILQQAIYCGVPAANHAVKEAGLIVAELGLLKG